MRRMQLRCRCGAGLNAGFHPQKTVERLGVFSGGALSPKTLTNSGTRAAHCAKGGASLPRASPFGSATSRNAICFALQIRATERRPPPSLQRGRVTAFCCNPTAEQRCQSVWLEDENLLDHLLELSIARLRALPFDFLGKRIKGAKIFWIEVGGLSQVGDRLCRLTAIAFEDSQQAVDVIVLRHEIARFFEPLGGRVEV